MRNCYDSQKALDVLNSLWGLIEAYGKPVCIYCDNGKQYVSKCLRETCARLGIRLLRHLPMACSSKGYVKNFIMLRNLSEWLFETAQRRIRAVFLYIII